MEILKPILFNTEMVKAILEGRKTMTRRIIRPQPGCIQGNNCYKYNSFVEFEEIKPYCKVDDTLWVRETWADMDADFDNKFNFEIQKNMKYIYKVTDTGEENQLVDLCIKKWRPSIHMPKAAARIFLKVTNVKVERLQGITTIEIENEGTNLDNLNTGEEYIHAFQSLWASTIKEKDMGTYDWYSNPWVWVIEFEKVEGQQWI